MAIVNVGVMLALSEMASKAPAKVLLVDWDLEAPGLEVYFQKSKRASLDGDPQFVPGILDLLESRTDGRPISWQSCLLKVDFSGGSLDLITSGRKPHDLPPSGSSAWPDKMSVDSSESHDRQELKNYRQRVQKLNWQELFDKHDIGNYILDLREAWRAKYDYVLIDSRTGITDIGDICTVLLPDALVLLFVSNYQNVEGVRDIVDRARSARSRLPIDRQRLMVVPVPSRDESRSEYDSTIKWRGIFDERLGFLFDDWLHKDYKPIDVLNSLYIPYFPIWSFGEKIPVLDGLSELSDPASLGAAYSRLAQLLKCRLDWGAIATSGLAEIAQKQAELAQERSARESTERDLTSIRLQRRYLLVGGGAFVAAAGVATGVYMVTQAFGQSVIFSEALNLPILGANVSPAGNDFATALRDGSARTWTESGALKVRYEGHSGAVNDVAYSPNASQLVTASADRTAMIWRVFDPKVLYTLKGHTGNVNTAQFSPDGRQVVTASSDGTARIWEPLFPDKFILLRGHEGPVLGASFDSDGSRVVTASQDGTARIWDAVTGDIKFSLRGDGPVTAASFSPDASKIVTASSDKTARVWNASDGSQIRVLKQDDALVTASYSPDGLLILTATRDFVIRLWMAETVRNIESKGLRGTLTAARFFPDGKSVLVTSFDGSFVGIRI
jgi:hypothetical protein